MSEQPLREPAFLVLTALASGPLHGYALVEDVLRLSDGQVRLHTGTLYAMLDRLREAGLIVVDREEIVESRLRRYYALTDAGIARLAAETERMRGNANAAARQLGRRRPAPGGPRSRKGGAPPPPGRGANCVGCGPRRARHEAPKHAAHQRGRAARAG